METLLRDNRSEYTSLVIHYRKTRFTNVYSTEFKALHYNPQCDNTSFKIHRSTRASSNAASIRQDQRPPSRNLLATRQCLQFHQPGFKTFQTWQKFHRSGDNLPISHGHDVLMFLFSMIQGEDADQLCRCGRHGHPRIREKMILTMDTLTEYGPSCIHSDSSH